MKKLKISLFAMAIAVGTFAAFAFSPVANTVAQDDPHWFDSEDGTYLGQRSEALQRVLCGPDGQIDCADAFTAVSGGNPSGDFIDTMKKQ